MSAAAPAKPAEPETEPLDLSRPKGRRQIANTVVTGLVVLATVLAIIPLVWVLWSVISQGLPTVLDANWWVDDQVGVTYRCPSEVPRPGCDTGGGAGHAILGTVLVSLICTIIAVPFAIMGAIFLIEYGRGTKLGRVVSFMVDILSGIPSIVAALFIYAVVITLLGLDRSAYAAALALVMLMLPVVFRSTEEMLKLVPDSLREASYALGTPKWKTIVHVVIPTSIGGITTGVVLGLARVMGETAPLLILIGFAVNLTADPLARNIATLPTMINNGRTAPPQMPGYERAWGAALTLILLVMVLNLAARGIARATRLKER